MIYLYKKIKKLNVFSHALCIKCNNLKTIKDKWLIKSK
jgi:hypothetical protein